ncbi:DUF4876 domain-containing protein [Pontibacter sp. SGAir0037]|uniref:DUF4876 domain-containing protein n=1 Tax=Pontibacter sp. SGAir0037 TaxID=2571030 RepID=UPI0010CCBF42|nr:DUF4876 domain-containing protein [Pontibacter sp. SGAir0037]QCR21625.1 hypothetical protein C1N53_04205 [Pontibacter sp. SGAir0037]
MMKKAASILMLLLAVVAFWSCEKKDDAIPTVTVQVSVTNPDNYSQSVATNTKVTLTGSDNGEVKTITIGDATQNGVAIFTDVIPGTYTVAATRSLSPEEAYTLTGARQKTELNASQTGVMVVPQNPISEVELQLGSSIISALVFKEVYYTGSRTPSGGTYFSDQFVEIYNNSDEVIYLDNLCIADIYGVSGQINTNSEPTPFKSDRNHVYASSVWRIPGTGTQRPLQPGQSIIIAQDGINHKEANATSPVDLSNAEWETYNERPDGRDADAPNVPNLERLYFTGGFDWNVPVFGPALVIFKIEDFNSLEKVAIPGSSTSERIKIPNSLILDAFEGLQNAESGNFKRIPTALDAGFVYASDTYTMENFRRKTSNTVNGRRVLQNTNNTANDFEKLAKPTPKGFN